MFKGRDSRTATGTHKTLFGRMRQKITPRGSLIIVAALLLFLLQFDLEFDNEPYTFDVKARAIERIDNGEKPLPTGYVTVATLAEVTETVLNKRGGYISNDILPPFAWLEKLPTWEYGVMLEVRDLTHGLHSDFSLFQTHSEAHPSLVAAQNHFDYDHRRWRSPSSEDEYRRGVKALDKYLAGLKHQTTGNTQFHVRADRLENWLATIETKLDRMNQQLETTPNFHHMNDPEKQQSIEYLDREATKHLYFETRGRIWALYHFLAAIEIDNDVVLTEEAHRLVGKILDCFFYVLRASWNEFYNNKHNSILMDVPSRCVGMGSNLRTARFAIQDLRELLSEG